MNKTSIEWCDYSVNPVKFRPHGFERTVNMCQRTSPGCQKCYAESITRRFWPKNSSVSFPGYTAQGIAAGEFVLDEKQLKSVLKHKKPCRVFWGDMTDLFGDWVPFWMLDACFAVCALTPHITHMFLTKRPERMCEYFNHLQKAADDWAPKTKDGKFTPSDVLNLRHLARHTIDGHTYTEAFPKHPWPLPNVMLGTSCENQKYADERIPFLCGCPTKYRFISAEPLIDEIDLEWPKSIWPDGPPMCCSGLPNECGCMGLPVEPPLCYKLSLVIVGGESGTKARPMQPEWARKLRDQCKHWKVSFFCKQMGSAYGEHKGKNLPDDLNIREFPGEQA